METLTTLLEPLGSAILGSLVTAYGSFKVLTAKVGYTDEKMVLLKGDIENKIEDARRDFDKDVTLLRKDVTRTEKFLLTTIHEAVKENHLRQMEYIEKIADSFSTAISRTVEIHQDMKVGFERVHQRIDEMQREQREFQAMMQKDFVSKDTCIAREQAIKGYK